MDPLRSEHPASQAAHRPAHARPAALPAAWDAADVREAEAPLLAGERAFAGGLMDRAATALAGAVRDVLHERGLTLPEATVVGLVGPGSNGGDTLHALARLASRGAQVLAVRSSPRLHDGGATALGRAGGRTVSLAEGQADAAWLGDVAAEALAADVLLDGLLGIGSRGALEGSAGTLVTLLGELLDQLPAGAGARPTVIAVDVPSGVGVDDGTVPGPVLAADRTVTFGVPKPAHLLPPAAHLVGSVQVVDLGLGPVLTAQGRAPSVRRLGAADVAAVWPVPGARDHKYVRGVVGVVAGSAAYPGAAVLTVLGAQGAGAGMVRYVGPPEVAGAVLAAAPEVVSGQDPRVRVQSWVVGPGVDPDDDVQVDRARQAVAAALADGVPLVLDAGGLGLLAPGEGVSAGVVLTPHAGELATLLTRWGEPAERAAVEAEPLRYAQLAHTLTGATVLLKGAVTLVVGPSGVLSQDDAPAWLATAGAGDVLAGCLGAVLAARPGDDATAVARGAAAAVAVHGRAASRACPGGPITAGQVARALPATIAAVLRVGDWRP